MGTMFCGGGGRGRRVGGLRLLRRRLGRWTGVLGLGGERFLVYGSSAMSCGGATCLLFISYYVRQ